MRSRIRWAWLLKLAAVADREAIRPRGVGLGVLLVAVLTSCGSTASIQAGSDITQGDVSVPESGTYQYSLTITSGDADPGVLRLIESNTTNVEVITPGDGSVQLSAGTWLGYSGSFMTTKTSASPCSGGLYVGDQLGTLQWFCSDDFGWSLTLSAQ
jgi:hypothetical protein